MDDNGSRQNTEQGISAKDMREGETQRRKRDIRKDSGTDKTQGQDGGEGDGKRREMGTRGK